MTAYYNEFDPHAAAWLRELVKDGFIADGVVDERSVVDVSAGDLAGFTQCHFFAGIGGWSAALRLACWPDDREVWTGSCPCQPFSTAGKGQGAGDERHLWPFFSALIAERRPAVVFGEQVASALGLAWFHSVRTDLETSGYAAAGVDLCAAGLGAPHIRQRLWWVGQRLADASSERHDGEPIRLFSGGSRQAVSETARSGTVGGLADADVGGQPGQGIVGRPGDPAAGEDREVDRAIYDGGSGWLENGERPGPDHGGWSDADWLFCRDGRWRPVEPGSQPLVNGLPRGMGHSIDPGAPINAKATSEARVMRLRGYGNATVPQVAAEFISAVMA